MTDIIIDSSVAAKWILPEPDSSEAQRVLVEVTAAGSRLIVLDLVYPEVANAIWKQRHRGLATHDEARQFLQELTTIPVHAEPAAPLLTPALEIAMTYDRSLYDALFVALVQALGLSGVTADEPLYNSIHSDFPTVILLRDW